MSALSVVALGEGCPSLRLLVHAVDTGPDAPTGAKFRYRVEATLAVSTHFGPATTSSSSGSDPGQLAVLRSLLRLLLDPCLLPDPLKPLRRRLGHFRHMRFAALLRVGGRGLEPRTSCL